MLVRWVIFPSLRRSLLLIALSAGIACPQSRSIYEQAASDIQAGHAPAAIQILEARLHESPQDLRALTLMGMALLAQDRREEGNGYFQKALQVNPDYAPALRNLASSHMAAGKPDSARAQFERLIALTPADPGGYLGLAQACIQLGEPDIAAQTLQRLPQSADPQAHFAAGNLFAGIQRYEDAAREFQRAQNGYPDPYDAGFNLMLAYLKLRRHSSAVQIGEGLLARGFRKPELYNLLAQAYEGDGKTPQAYEALRTATTIDPTDPTNYLDLIAVCLTHRNYDLALEIADVAAARLPNSDRIHLQRGIVLAMKEDFDGARIEFERSMKLAPDANIPPVALALMLLQMDRPEDAVTLLRKVVKARPDYLAFWFLGEALSRTNTGTPEESEAIAALSRSVTANPNVPQSRILLAKLLAHRGEFDLAEKHLTRALELDPENVPATYQLAQVCQKKGDTVRARELFAKVRQAKAEDREQFTKGGLQHIIRAGSQ